VHDPSRDWRCSKSVAAAPRQVHYCRIHEETPFEPIFGRLEKSRCTEREPVTPVESIPLATSFKLLERAPNPAKPATSAPTRDLGLSSWMLSCSNIWLEFPVAVNIAPGASKVFRFKCSYCPFYQVCWPLSCKHPCKTHLDFGVLLIFLAKLLVVLPVLASLQLQLTFQTWFHAIKPQREASSIRVPLILSLRRPNSLFAIYISPISRIHTFDFHTPSRRTLSNCFWRCAFLSLTVFKMACWNALIIIFSTRADH